MTERFGYGFTNEQKATVHERAGISCEFPAEPCSKKNTGIVNHLTGVAVAKLDNKDKAAISDVNMNALMLCLLHANLLDVQEKYEYECLKAEKGTTVFRRTRPRRRHH